MSAELATVLLLLAAAIAMFAVGRPRMDAVALIMLTLLPLTGAITVEEALAGFSDPNIVLIAALFVVGDGLARTGVARRLGDVLITRAGSTEGALVVLLMLTVAALGSFMSSTGVVAIFVAVALRIARKSSTPPSQLMMPLSVAALISGMMTLVATSVNLVVNGELTRHGFAGFRFFTFTPIGVPVLILGILYMLYARRWLPAKQDADRDGARRPSVIEWIEAYHLAEREHRLRVTARSPLIGQTIEEANLHAAGADIVAVDRGRRSGRQLPHLRVLNELRDLVAPARRTDLDAGDILFIYAKAEDFDVEALKRRFALEAMPLGSSDFSDRSQEIGMAEVMVTADSRLVGKSIANARFRERYALTVMGLRRRADALRGDLRQQPLKIGDTLLVVGPWNQIDALQTDDRDLVVINLPTERDEVLPVRGRIPHALVCLAVMVGLMVSGVVTNVQAALIACLLMGVLRCIDLDSAYRAIHWKSLVLIVGMLPFSLALQRTGGVELAAEALRSVTGGAGIHVALSALFLVTAALGVFISNTATAVLMAPVALALADDMQASPYPFAMIVALAASASFVTPVSSPVNTMVVAVGNYSFGDFARVGLPLVAIVMVVSVILVPWLLPP